MDLLSMEFSVGISQQGFHKLHSTFQILLLQLVLCCFFKRGNFAISCLVLSACFRFQLRVISQFHPQWSPLECLSFSLTYRLQESNFPSYSLELPGSLKHLLSFSCSKRIQWCSRVQVEASLAKILYRVQRSPRVSTSERKIIKK